MDGRHKAGQGDGVEAGISLSVSGGSNENPASSAGQAFLANMLLRASLRFSALVTGAGRALLTGKERRGYPAKIAKQPQIEFCSESGAYDSVYRVRPAFGPDRAPLAASVRECLRNRAFATMFPGVAVI